MENEFKKTKVCRNVENVDILRPLPEGNDPNQKYFHRQTSAGAPLIDLRKKDDYYSTKTELSTTEMIDISSKIVSPVDHFRFKNKVYKLSELEFQTLYQTEEIALISDNSLVSSYHHHFNNMHKKSNLETPIKVYYFKSKSRSGRDGTTKKDQDNMEYYHYNVYQMILYYFLLKLNIESRKANYDLPYHIRLNYYAFRSEVIKINYHPILNLYKYTMTVGVYRTNKVNGFLFYLEVYFRPQNLNVIIEKCLVVGVFTQDKIIFNNLGGINTQLNTKRKLNKADINDQDDDILGNTYQTVLKASKTTDKYLKSIGSHPSNVFSRDVNKADGRRCFKSDGEIYHEAQTYNDCLSYTDSLGRVGIWDNPCQKDEDCPFYQANKNYPNQRGKCENGYCELPLGMKRIGFKHYAKDKPLCYNCHKDQEIMTANGRKIIKKRDCSGVECNKCCHLQPNKNLYPNLNSPDFAFQGDQTDRKKGQSFLEKLQLGMASLI